MHAFAKGLIGRIAQERIEPDNAVGTGSEPGHFGIQNRRIAGIPAVTDDHYKGLGGHHIRSHGVIEFFQALTNFCAAGPVVHDLADQLKRRINVTPPQQGRNTRHTGAKHNGFHPAQPILHPI